MTIYKRVYVSTVECSSIEVSELDEKRFALEEIDLEELWNSYDEIKSPKHVYTRDFDHNIDYSLSRS